jgi:hypothetical protein
MTIYVANNLAIAQTESSTVHAFAFKEKVGSNSTNWYYFL